MKLRKTRQWSIGIVNRNQSVVGQSGLKCIGEFVRIARIYNQRHKINAGFFQDFRCQHHEINWHGNGDGIQLADFARKIAQSFGAGCQDMGMTHGRERRRRCDRQNSLKGWNAHHERAKADLKRVGLGSENLVENDAGLLFIRTLGESEFGDEDLLGFGQHSLLARRQSTVKITTVKVTNDFCHLDDITGSKLFNIGLVTTGPVGWFFGVWLTEDIENSIKTGGIDYVAYANQVHILCGNPNSQVALGNLQY